MSASTRLRPGPDRFGTVVIERSRIVACPACGEPRLDLAGPHSPQIRIRDGRPLVVDCVGQEIQP